MVDGQKVSRRNLRRRTHSPIRLLLRCFRKACLLHSAVHPTPYSVINRSIFSATKTKLLDFCPKTRCWPSQEGRKSTARCCNCPRSLPWYLSTRQKCENTMPSSQQTPSPTTAPPTSPRKRFNSTLGGGERVPHLVFPHEQMNTNHPFL